GGTGVFVLDELCMPRNTAPPMMITAGMRSVHTGRPRFGAGGGTTCCWPGGHGNATGAGGYAPLAPGCCGNGALDPGDGSVDCSCGLFCIAPIMLSGWNSRDVATDTYCWRCGSPTVSTGADFAGSGSA